MYPGASLRFPGRRTFYHFHEASNAVLHRDGRFTNVPGNAFKYLCYPEMLLDMVARVVPFPEELCETIRPGALVRPVPGDLAEYQPLIQ